jgi:hypothetical protein
MTMTRPIKKNKSEQHGTKITVSFDLPAGYPSLDKFIEELKGDVEVAEFESVVSKDTCRALCRSLDSMKLVK